VIGQVVKTPETPQKLVILGIPFKLILECIMWVLNDFDMMPMIPRKKSQVRVSFFNEAF
jgi:hypothetical protein